MSYLKRDLGDYLFYASLTVLVSLTFTANIDSIAAVLLPLSYVSLALLAMALVFRIRQYKAAEILVLVGLGGIALYQFVYSGDNSLMKFVLLLAAMRGISFRECIRYDFALRVFWTIALIVSSYLGLAEDIITNDALRDARHSLGFSNANQLGMAVLIVCLEALYLANFKLRLPTLVAFVVVAVWLDAVSGSRSSTAIIFLALILALINTAWPQHVQKSLLLRITGELAVPVLFALTWIVVSYYQQGAPWAVSLNEATTDRIGHIVTYATLFSPRLLGSDVSSAGMTLDTLYAYLVYGYGLVVTLVYLVTQPLLFRKLWLGGGQPMCFILLLLSFYGLSERLWLCVEYNALMLAFAMLLYKDDRYASEKDALEV